MGIIADIWKRLGKTDNNEETSRVEEADLTRNEKEAYNKIIKQQQLNRNNLSNETQQEKIIKAKQRIARKTQIERQQHPRGRTIEHTDRLKTSRNVNEPEDKGYDR